MSISSISNLKVLVVIPTYNEQESINLLIYQLNKLNMAHLNILIIDDNSPDGTADYVENLGLPNIDILRRSHKSGLGSAYKDAIKYALSKSSPSKAQDFEYLVSMDGDGSHQVQDLQTMLETLIQIKSKESDQQLSKISLILGSRWVPGGGIRNWSKPRIWLSKAGTKYARFALRLPINDLTGGFRIYPRNTLEHIDLDQITSNGYCYQIEMAFAVDHLNKKLGLETIELPITFVERANGVSKMNFKIVLEAMWQVTKLGLGLRLRPKADKLHYVK